MDFLYVDSLSVLQLGLLAVCVAVALGFEFVNGFHDTANAVATVIYTNSLPARWAVLLSGTLNFLGVWMGGIAVAMGIVKLLPVELLVASGQTAGLAMVLALLLAAITWNLFTWWLGLPASSSHTLIGSILGVGLASSWLAGHPGEGVNWHKAQEIGLALLLSPLFGFLVAGGLLLVLRRTVSDPRLFDPKVDGRPPPWFVRALLVFTCGGVSLAHGSNDGQKGVGILMLVVIGIVPVGYSLNLDAPPAELAATVASVERLEGVLAAHPDLGPAREASAELGKLRLVLGQAREVAEVEPELRFEARQAILLADRALSRLEKEAGASLAPAELATVARERPSVRRLTEYAPTWVLMAIALALGVGTTVGWKRIVVTVGEKIGKTHLTYAQGASAELVAMSTIGLSAWAGLPVSTTHVLSSGVAGTMVAARSGLQGGTVRNILLAWVLTLPVSMGLAGGFYLALRALLGAG